MTDGDLVRRSVAGDTAAYGELARRWYRRLLAYCEARVRKTEAEDLAQDILIRGFCALQTLTSPDQFGSWLRGIAAHVCADWCRRQHRPGHVRYDATPSTNGGPSRNDHSYAASPVLDQIAAPTREPAVANDERIYLLDQLQALPEDLREVILLRYYDELTYEEMADWLGVARATVNERLAKARALLRIRLAKLRSDT